MNATEEFDWHLHQYRLGSIESDRMQFDWKSLAERRLVLIPSYEPNLLPVYDAFRSRAVAPHFVRTDVQTTDIPHPGRSDFFVEVQSSIASVSEESGHAIYLNFYSEEAYLAVTPEAAELLFMEGVYDLLLRSLARCVADGSLLMRRHRHALRVFRDALRHIDSMHEVVPRPISVML
jgi:hypothetical protein